ncbi:uncharacterized protein LOC123558981 [Mercenaria mercenaria]|uniref:uncharacterized protein LOC123558981 n=1 Tax=Mercenaria mercenaria TaxID=6596 RepID=UPI00234EB8D8|nr:uncharacterized protein LOC123558981 [Mercenaria mercenaria]
MELRIYFSLYAYAIVKLLLISCIDCECVLPLSSGIWISSSRGTWTVPENRTEIQNFKATLALSQTMSDLTCISSSGNQYILGTSSDIQLFPGIFVNSYTCIEFQTTSHTPSKYEFYFVTDIDIATGEPFTSNVNTVCDGTVAETASNTNILLADGTAAETVKESLPNVIRGDYTVTITDQNSATSNQTLLGSCNDTSAFYFSEIVNATQAVSAVGFSDSGVLYNMKSFTSNGVTYIYTYNNDTSVNSFSTYTFSCWAVAQASGSSLVYATVFPEVCQVNQNASHVPSGGQVLILEPSVTCREYQCNVFCSFRFSVHI